MVYRCCGAILDKFPAHFTLGSVGLSGTRFVEGLSAGAWIVFSLAPNGRPRAGEGEPVWDPAAGASGADKRGADSEPEGAVALGSTEILGAVFSCRPPSAGGSIASSLVLEVGPEGD